MRILELIEYNPTQMYFGHVSISICFTSYFSNRYKRRCTSACFGGGSKPNTSDADKRNPRVEAPRRTPQYNTLWSIDLLAPLSLQLRCLYLQLFGRAHECLSYIHGTAHPRSTRAQIACRSTPVKTWCFSPSRIN